MFYSNGYKSKKGALSKRRIFGVALATLAVFVNTGIFVYHLIKKNWKWLIDKEKYLLKSINY